MENPKVSIIVPVFNVQAYLRECLDSILNQTLTDIEIICGDGGSTDGSLEIIQEYAQKDSRVRFITKKGSGYGQSVNECMDMAEGEYIGIVESDDAVKQNTYEVLYGLAKENDLDWIRGDIYFYYSGRPKEKQLQRESIILGRDFYNVVLNPQTDYRPYKSGFRTWSGIYKTEFLNKYSIRHNETAGGSYQDIGFYLKTLYYAERIYFVDQAFYMWRQDNPGSSVHYDSAKLVEKSLKEWSLNQEYLNEHPEIGKRAIASYHYRKFLSYLWTMDMANKEDKKTVKRVAYQELSEALSKGEIDKGFFEPWEWIQFLESMQDWREYAQESIIRREECYGFAAKNPSFMMKALIKRTLRAGGSITGKVVSKMMRNLVHFWGNEMDMLHVQASDTQRQIKASSEDIQESMNRIYELLEDMQCTIEQNELKYQQIIQELEILKGKRMEK